MSKSSSNGDQPELDLVQVRLLASIRGAPENDQIYLPIGFDDPGIEELARSIKKHGIQEPLLVRKFHHKSKKVAKSFM